MSENEDSVSSDTTNKIDTVVDKEIQEAMAPYINRLNENTVRVTNLVNLYISLKKSEEFSSNPATDEILRACVVFTHASLEDFLRTLAAKLLPYAGEKVLDGIPLTGTDGRAEKFSLGRLAKFRGKTVDEVITKSVMYYLERSNFSSIDDITKLLQSLDLNIVEVSQWFPKLEELMNRRHQIVHRADRAEPLGTDEQNVLPINGEEVLEWVRTVVTFIGDLLPGIVKKRVLSRINTIESRLQEKSEGDVL